LYISPLPQTTRPSHLYKESRYEVWRRYKDFEWLRAQVERSHPTLILPPLPGKQVARYFDHMSETFLEERQRALDKFLRRLTVHPYFSFSTDLKAFLTATPEGFAGYVQESQGRQKLMDRLSSSVRQAQTSFMLKDVDPEFAKQLAYFSELGDKMSVMERIGARLHSERETLQTAQDDFSVALFHWAANEQVMTQPLQKLANCAEHCSHHVRKLNEANIYSMMVAVKEYQLYSASAVAAIRRRDTLQLEVERSGLDRERKKRHHEEATASGKVQKVMKLADDLEKVELAAEKAQDQLSQANEELRVDVEQWHEAKNKEVCHFMRQFASNHVDYHQKCFDEWESALKRLRSASVSPSPATAATAAAQNDHLAALTSSSRDSDETQSDT
jgi:sorting nexin-1/2